MNYSGYKYLNAGEIGNIKYLRAIVQRDYFTYSGRILERYFTDKLAAHQSFSAIGSWWERGHTNEIDIVAVNEAEKRVLFAEVKRNKQNISLPALRERAQKLQSQLTGYAVRFEGFSFEDM